MNSKPSTSRGMPFSFIEWYVVLNCWVCSAAILSIVLDSSSWQSLATPMLLTVFALVGGLVLLAVQCFILTRRDRGGPLKSFHFWAPAVIFGAAFLISLVGLFVHQAQSLPNNSFKADGFAAA